MAANPPASESLAMAEKSEEKEEREVEMQSRDEGLLMELEKIYRKVTEKRFH